MSDLVDRLRKEITRTVSLDLMHQEAADRLEAAEKLITQLERALELATVWSHTSAGLRTEALAAAKAWKGEV